MTVALDLGCSEFRALRREASRLVAKRIPAMYTMLADTPQHRRALAQAGVASAEARGSLVVIGEHALDVATLLSRPLIPLFAAGQLPAEDPVGRQVCAWLIDLLIPRGSGQPCLLALPSGTAGVGEPADRTSRFITQLVRLRGYAPIAQHHATALALAELEDREFTGACLCVGAESLSLAITHLGTPVLEARFAKGTREVLEAYAQANQKFLWDSGGNRYLDLPGIQAWLEQGDISLQSRSSGERGWLANALEELLLSAWFNWKRKLERCRHPLLDQPLRLVISGGVTRIPGFVELAADALTLSQVRLKIDEVRAAQFDPYAVARGLLIQAELGAEQLRPVAAA